MSLTLSLLMSYGVLAGPSAIVNSNHKDNNIEQRVEQTLAKMTLEEKVDMIGGVKGFYLRGYDHLGLPELKMSDGPMGVRNFGPTTSYPAGETIASTFNPALAEAFGREIGRDARARGVHIWLGPGVNLTRITQNGRNFEYFGEDPLLSGKLAAGVIRGVQSQGVVATIKHFAANNNESDRMHDSSDVDERTLRELYLRQFEIAIRESGPWALMCSYNRLNKTYTSENGWLLDKVLRKDWGYRGIVMSDWGAVHSALGPALNGMDLEMPGPDFMNRQNLLPAIQEGKVPVAKIDEKIRRILRMEYSMEFEKRSQEVKSVPLDNPEGHKVALEIARQGTVLLKNKGGILPLAKVKRILVVGPNSMRYPQGGGSAWTTPIRKMTLAHALKQEAPAGTTVSVAPYGEELWKSFGGTDFFVPGSKTQKGAKVEAFNNRRLQGQPVYVGQDEKLDHVFTDNPPFPGVNPHNYSVRWTTEYTAKESGEHILYARSDDGAKIYVNDKLILNAWRDRGVESSTAGVRMEAGKTYRLKIEYYEAEGEAIAQFGILPLKAAYQAQVPSEEVAKADVIVASIGFDSNREGEGADRPFSLPEDQESLLEALIQTGKKIVVVNNSGASIDTSKWLSRVDGFVQAWYSGGIGAQAVAEILFGKTNPSGKLTTSFPVTMKGTYYEKAYPAVNGDLVYSEKREMGYRWFDAKGVRPLYPFGFGLSYSSFKVSSGATKTKGKELLVPFSVKNTSNRTGSEIVQVYVKRPGETFKDLVAFNRQLVSAGKRESGTIKVPFHNFASWVNGTGWVVKPGKYTVYVGTSSRDLVSTSTFNIK